MKKIKVVFLFCIISITLVSAQNINVIPYPSHVESRTGVFPLTAKTILYYHPDYKNEATFLQQIFLEERQWKMTIREQKEGKQKAGNIYLVSSADVELGKEGYVLEVNKDNISISGKESPGVFYGIQTLRQLIQQKDGSTAVVPQLTIKDQPRFAWRGFMLDEARYFKGSVEVKRILDEMALLKMNTFHWHLTDDTGWRIEIKKYPMLTKIGSTRKESEMGTWLSDKMDGKVHSGFYTQEEMKDIIRYAEARHITIIPEIEMPGHASAAIASYPWLGSENQPIEVPTKFRIQLNVFNVVDPKVIQFLHDVLDEVMALFPSDIVHIGGDEVKYDQWKKSEMVNEYMRQNNIHTPADLQISFTNSISRYLEQNKHRMMGWNEILGGHHTNNDSLDAKAQQKLSDDVIIHFWTGDQTIVNKAAEKGYNVVNSFYEYTYLDFDYQTTSLEKAYSFDPIPTSLPAQFHGRVLGLGCQMWGEWIPTVEKMNEQIYPRIAAFAEIGWADKKNKDFSRFTNTLPVYFTKHWKERGIVLLPAFR